MTTINISELELELKTFLSKEPRKDSEYRWAIATSQLGPLASHMTHDPKLNPIARPYVTKDGEESDLGHALAQLMIYGISRKLNVERGIEEALKALRSYDYVKCEPSSNDQISGQCGMIGCIRGKAIIDPFMIRYNIPSDGILITSHPTSDARLKRYAGVVTDHGGSGCHAAIVCREFGIPCLVGTGNATEKIKDGEMIEIEITENGGIVRRINI